MPHHDRRIQQGKADVFPAIKFQSFSSPEENVAITHKSGVENRDWRLKRAEPQGLRLPKLRPYVADHGGDDMLP